MNAFAISCWKPNVFHLQQAVACVASIREVGHDEDIVIMTIEDRVVPKLKRVCASYDVQVKKLMPLSCKAHGRKNRSKASQLDINKTHYWSLTEYDSVIGIDCDCLLHRRSDKFWNRDKFIVFHGGDTGPVCSAAMTVNPNMEMFHEMKELVATSSFNPNTGWNNCGPIKGVKGWDEPDWRFLSADSLQGFLIYYFHLRKNNFHANLQRGLSFIYHAGDQKSSDWYLGELRRLLGGKMTI